MTGKQYLLILTLYEDATQSYGRRCHDLDRALIKDLGFTDAEKLDVVKRYHEWNGDDDEIDLTDPEEFDRIPCFAMLDFFMKRLLHRERDIAEQGMDAWRPV